MEIVVRKAEAKDVEAVSSVLVEAATWLEERGIPLWQSDELTPERIEPDVLSGLFIIAEADEEVVGVMRYQLEDSVFWPDAPQGEAAYIHRLAVRRRAAGGSVSGALLEWAVKQARASGRRYIRLDFDSMRPQLRAVYEHFGFRHHSDRQVGPYRVARHQYDIGNVTGTSLGRKTGL